jgi:hypothetical protein
MMSTNMNNQTRARLMKLKNAATFEALADDIRWQVRPGPSDPASGS